MQPRYLQLFRLSSDLRRSLVPACVALIAASMVITASPSIAGQLTYTPVNPSFGGSPFNGEWLQNNATAQRRAESGDGGGGQPEIPDFSNLLGDLDAVVGIDTTGNN